MKYKSAPIGFLIALILSGTCLAADTATPAVQVREGTASSALVAAAKRQTIRNINRTPLSAEDLQLGGVRLGYSLANVEELRGSPLSMQAGRVRDTFQWEDIKVRFIQDMAYGYSVRDDLDMGTSFPSSGADAILVEKEGIPTHRGVFVGDSRENVVRAYGTPGQIYWDGPKQQMYMLYELDDKQLIFTVAGNKVKSMELAFAGERFPKIQKESFSAKNLFSGKEFEIAGYTVGDTFKEYSWLDWRQKATNATDEIWYFPGFGVRMDKKSRLISSLFITDNGMVTKRGVSVGDQLSTLEALYGEPQKLEMNLTDPHPQSAYIYFSQDHRIALVFYINETQKVVQNIVSMKNPQIQNPLQQPLNRVRDVRIRNQQRAL